MARILIVEDHQALLRSLRRGLESLGYAVIVTETGEAGYRIATSEAVDLIVLDLMLPDRSGLDILSNLRSAGFGKPVLILTARDSLEDRQRARTCGADGFLAKPFAFADLVSSVKELLQLPGTGTSTPKDSPCAD